MDEAKKSAGQIVTEFNEKAIEPVAPIDLVKEGSHKNYENNLEECIRHYKSLYRTDFYIEKRIQHEWPLGGVPQPFMKGRRSCPTPTHLQTTIKYHYNDEAIEYLWTIPGKWQFAWYKKNALLLDPVKKKILDSILKFESGDLLRMAKKLNKEPEDTKTAKMTDLYRAIN